MSRKDSQRKWRLHWAPGTDGNLLSFQEDVIVCAKLRGKGEPGGSHHRQGSHCRCQVLAMPSAGRASPHHQRAGRVSRAGRRHGNWEVAEPREQSNQEPRGLLEPPRLAVSTPWTGNGNVSLFQGSILASKHDYLRRGKGRRAERKEPDAMSYTMYQQRLWGTM